MGKAALPRLIAPTHTHACEAVGIYRDTTVTLTWALHIEGGFPGEVWRSRVQDREPLAEVKRPAGGERRASRLSMGRRKSSSTCLATSMDSSRSKSPSWSELAKRGMLGKLGGLMVPNPHRECSICSSQRPESRRDRTSSTLAGTPTRPDSSHWLLGDSLVPLISLDITSYHDPKEFIFPHLDSSVSQDDWPEGSTLHSGMSFTYIYYHTIQQVTGSF